MTKPHWKITYTSRVTGERKTYMGMGFKSPESAQNELGCILRTRDNYSDDEIESWILSAEHVPSYIAGTNWKVEPIKFTK